MAKNEKAPVSQGKTGAYNIAITTGLEPATSRSTAYAPETTTALVSRCYGVEKSMRTGERTVSQDKPISTAPNALPAADLVTIAASWPTVPDPIKVAVKAVLAPYLIAEVRE